MLLQASWQHIHDLLLNMAEQVCVMGNLPGFGMNCDGKQCRQVCTWHAMTQYPLVKLSQAGLVKYAGHSLKVTLKPVTISN